MSFTQINFNQHLEYQEDVAQLSNVYKKYVNQYKKDCAIHHTQWFSTIYFEQIRLKRYLANDKDEFAFYHVDINTESVKRFLVFFIYLDDNERGETNFIS